MPYIFRTFSDLAPKFGLCETLDVAQVREDSSFASWSGQTRPGHACKRSAAHKAFCQDSWRNHLFLNAQLLTAELNRCS
jgi:hypothetical protein